MPTQRPGRIIERAGDGRRLRVHWSPPRTRPRGVAAPATRNAHQLHATGGDPLKTTRERAEEKRQAKLEFVREQVDSGSLVIRKMTDAERSKYPPRPPRPKRFGMR